ncbi:hypothetical protein BDW71DRAFT_194202 [Aspergillus fruticulosus]
MSSPAASQRNTERPSSITIIYLATLAVTVLVALVLPANLFGIRRLAQSSWAAIDLRGRPLSSVAGIERTSSQNIHQSSVVNGIKMRTPVYFLSHGGPNIMYDVEHPAYKELGKIGKEITTKVKPRAVVVFSAHWQAGVDTVQVNTAEKTELIYDHYYKEKYPNVGSSEIANSVLDALKQAGIKAEGVKRGLDHGVWHYRLGEAVSKLREENILIIVSGMAVHNLRDFRFTFNDARPLPYTVSFDEALKDAATKPPAERPQALVDLLKRGDARQAHPYFDHLLPIHVGAGAAGEDRGKRLWTLKEGSTSWAQYRFGEVANASAL